MKLSEIRQRTDRELSTLEAQLRERLYAMRVQKTTNQVENTAPMQALRRDIARAKTVKRARFLGLEGSKDGPVS